MPQEMRLFVIRHGESEANLDRYMNAVKPDHKIDLSPAGHEQADAAGRALVDYLNRKGPAHAASVYLPLRMWVSPFDRTRQTAGHVWSHLEAFCSREYPKAAERGPVPLLTRRESIHLREQEFGLFDGIPDEELASRFPVEHAQYAKYELNKGKFFARMPQGESRADVCQRVHQWFGTVHRDREVNQDRSHGIKNVVVVAHGVVNRAITMMWCGEPYEWFEEEKNPGNCSIRLIENGVDQGYIFDGFHPPKDHAKQERREAGEVA